MKKSLLILVAFVVAVPLVYSRWSHSHSAAPADARYQDRVWIDHMPRNERDVINVFAVLTQQPIGFFQATSAWRGNFEAFRYEAHDGELRVVFPQTGDKEKLRVKAKRCNERGMDFCLEVQGASRGVKKYYSREGWEIGSLEDERAIVKTITH